MVHRTRALARWPNSFVGGLVERGGGSVRGRREARPARRDAPPSQTPRRQFRGTSAFAKEAEARFHGFVTKTQLPIVTRRLWRLAVLFVCVTLPDAFIRKRSAAFVLLVVWANAPGIVARKPAATLAIRKRERFFKM